MWKVSLSINNYRFWLNGGVAHLGEHLVRNQKVVGSIPITSTTFFGS